ncbi:MAG: hypothetical protein QXN45_02315 [Candidatus Thermoplasmatota archaeon]
MDNKGRIPFSLLGVFLLIASIFTSSIISNLQREYSLKHAETMESSSLKYALLNFEQEMVRILRYSGLEAMKIVGSSPVFYLPANDEKLDYEAARKYGGENPFFSSIDKEKIMGYNKNWTRDLMIKSFNEYLEAIFKNDKYRIGKYAINIIDYPSYENIRLEDIKMNLNRSIEFLYIKDKEYTIYWKAIVDGIKIEVHDIQEDKKYQKDLSIATIIPSRLPLLMELVIDYEDNITGEFKPLMNFVTFFGGGIAELRALLQYSGSGINNIVSNKWLIPLTNLGMIIIQFLIFNSGDIVSIIKTALNLGKLFLEEPQEYSSYEPSEEDLFREYYEFDTSDIYNKEVFDKIKSGKGDQINPVLKVAEDLLYERNYVYKNNSYEIIRKEYEGYEIEKNGKKYLFNDTFSDKSSANTGTLEKIDEIVKNIYNINLKGEKIVNSFSESYEGERKGIKTGEEDWIKNIEWMDNKLNKDELISLPYSENVKFSFSRKEYYWDKENNASYTVIHLIEGEFRFRIPEIKSDIKDIFHNKTLDCRGVNHKDDNLETALRLFVNDFINFRDSCLDVKKLNKNNEVFEKNYELYDKVDVSWLTNRGEVFKELENILDLIEKDKEVYESKMLENVDANNLPNLNSIEEEREFLLQKFIENKKKYYDYTKNYYKEGDFYKSAGAKVISEGVRWYLNSIEEELNKQISIEKDLYEKIDEKLEEKNLRKINYENLRDLKIDFSYINIGLMNMKIEGEWNEIISVAVDCDPDFQEKNFKNICIFPLGLPLLPTPLTPWIVTINCWYVEIKGSHNLTLVDSNESMANQLFGHESQVLKRKNEEVINPISESIIGYNKEVNFSFVTMFFAITPPALPIADFAPPPRPSCPYCPIEEKNE